VVTENDRIRVLRIHLGPKETLPAERRPDRLILYLTDVKVRASFPDGSTKERTAKAGETLWQRADNVAEVNIGETAGESIVVEMRPPAVAGDEVKRLRANGTELAYIERGCGDPVVLVHGVLADYRGWSTIVDDLAKRFHVYAYSRRYHFPNSTSGDGRDYLPATHAADLLAFIDNLGLDGVHVVGHSYGGNVALLAALKHPDKIRTLVLIEPTTFSLIAGSEAGDKALADYGPLADRIGELLGKNDNDGAVTMALEYLLRPTTFPSLPEKVRAMFLSNVATLRFTVNDTTPVARDQLYSLPMPVLLLGGADSGAEFKLTLDALARTLYRTARVTVPGGTDALPYNQAAAVSAALLEYFAQHR
jgi:pimeloyl-ACP methyl ester carboxylesterase